MHMWESKYVHGLYSESVEYNVSIQSKQGLCLIFAQSITFQFIIPHAAVCDDLAAWSGINQKPNICAYMCRCTLSTVHSSDTGVHVFYVKKLSRFTASRHPAHSVSDSLR